MKLLLIEYEANPDSLDGLGNTPLHYAAMAQNEAMILILLDAMPKLYEIMNKKGQTPKDYAKQQALKDLIQAYIDKANPPENHFIEELASQEVE